MIEEPYPLPVRENVTSLFLDAWGFDVPYFENGTRAINYPFVILPIGNWSLLSLLLPDYIDHQGIGESIDCVFIDNETTWGYRYENPSPQFLSNIYHIEFAKDDGVMSYYYGDYIRPGSVTNWTIECIRVKPGALSLEDTVLFGGIIGGLTIAIVALVIVDKRRGT